MSTNENQKDRKTEVNEILRWILENRHDEQAMNDIAYTAYPHTTKYKHFHQPNNSDDDIQVSS